MTTSNPLRRYTSTQVRAWALVTGSTNGMGYEWARQLALLGFSILLHGRSQAKLDEARGKILEEVHAAKSSSDVEVRALVADAGSTPPSLGDVGAVLDSFAGSEGAERPEGELRVVVNNIGITDESYPTLESLGDEDVIRMVSLNAVFPSLVAKRALPALKGASGPTLLINVSSLGAYAPSPYLSVYSGTKAYNLSFSRALYNEMLLEGSDVDVVAMVPGTVISGMNDGPPTSFLPLSATWVSAALDSLAPPTIAIPLLTSQRPGPVIVPWGPHSRGLKFLLAIGTSLGDKMTRNFVKDKRDEKLRKGEAK